MSFSSTSPTFRYNFTDGSFITVVNFGEDSPKYGNGEYTLTIPNLYVGDFDTYSGEITKYDLSGNEFVFSNRGVKINGVDYTRQASRFFFAYHPEDKIFTIARVQPIPEMFPRFSESQWYVSALFYDGDTSHTQYDSIGEVIAKGEEYVTNHNGWYTVANILPRTKGSVFHGATSFAVRNFSYESSFTDFLNNTAGSYTPINLNIDDSIEDFDPNIVPEPDPYDPGGDSGPGGGEGDFDGTGDDIEFPSLPTLSATDTGFITIFNPSLAQLQQLAGYMWSNLFDLATFKKLFADPMDCILGLSIVPVSVPNGSTQAVKVGNISTGVNMTVAASQYVEVDCGSLNVNEYWGAYLDYDPYTKAEIYLPYVGTHPVAVDDIMRKNVSVKYHVDILSGACTAYVKCGGSILYEFIGQCSSSIPITGNDWTSVINGVLSIAGSIGTMVATGGLSAPVSTGSVAGALTGAGTIASTAINTMKPSVEKSGAMAGTGGMLAVQTPYLILTRPRQALPSGQNSFMGYPSFMNEYLGLLSGYTEVESVHLSGIPGTDAEIQEIENLLMKGVIF